MIYVLTPEEVRKADQTAIIDYKIPPSILMENAARSIAELVKSIISNVELNGIKIALFCGVGNNGGDGFALARHLVDYGKVDVYWIGNPEKMSNETKMNFDILSNLEILVNHISNTKDLAKIIYDYDIIFDALIGVGGSEKLNGFVVDVLDAINKAECLKIAVDVPTGLNAETGNAHPNTFIADYTVTMFAIKTGMLLGRGPDFCGNIVVGQLGAPQNIVEQLCCNYIIEKKDILAWLPKRVRNSNKFDYGKALIVAGSVNMPGAAALVANSAIKAGTGLVHLYSPKSHPLLLPEVIPTELPTNTQGSLSTSYIEHILEASKNVNVIAIGPGIQINDDTRKIVEELIKHRSKSTPIILDADAITSNLLEFKLDQNVLLTPHLGEFARMIGINREEVALNSLALTKYWARKLNCKILLKGPTTIISDGEKTFLNTYGSSTLATAGSGDVLTGIISSLAAQGCDLLISAALGAYIHSKIGEHFASKIASRGLTASKMIDLIEVVYHELEKE